MDEHKNIIYPTTAITETIVAINVLRLYRSDIYADTRVTTTIYYQWFSMTYTISKIPTNKPTRKRTNTDELSACFTKA